MRNIKLTIEYDGTNYAGWQFQKNGLSVQEVVEKALLKICCEKVNVKGASRTDSGVHALGQVANFKTSSTAGLRAFKDGLNSVLPGDIIIHEAEESGEDFDPIKSAKKKRYRYCILNRNDNSAVLRNFTWHIREVLNIEKMKEASKDLLGNHDFRAFQATGTNTKTSVRNMLSIEFTKGPTDIIFVDFEGEGFLKYMVRNIVGTLAYIGSGRMQVDDMKMILESKDRTKAGPTAPPCGLFLMEVFY